MSLMDDVRGFEQRIVKRLEELRPLVEEYEQLRQLAERLELPTEPTPQTSPKSTGRRAARRSVKRPRSRRGPAAGGTRAVGEKRRARIVELVGERPGVTVAELSAELGVTRTSVHRIVRKLQADGELRKSGRGLVPAGEATNRE